ncbi:Re/Si-specific NAD(P)(+) transhydrogenase subunit alpha [Pseudemcibacter aquimaris]|uniref:Re/Si-specific NAD(P)(+) transhydrogenase subunit alpha n=1 Tax=Pseudemcibacter aquimaris TaxID=2857064 RepID=UPI0020127763|nr:Re/Si-specific NAD(P)(+) transhydrogenase subunit alpha [Pseudemcibacter aquimaris]MCC3860060.1 Re/Si-specific NAD(P)(+) transhydrogenase subunit alpha [Pseudemcibacter aquimaris]WDU57390.1 Re/Si-specific NAD(P)(+) transhydrogenase subunit alpha [Pseudemcibacter aquimaris]
MRITIPKERRAHENRVAATPDIIKKYIALGFNVTVESGAGLGSSISDDDYKQAGADVANDTASAYQDADIVLKVQKPLLASEGDIDEISLIKSGAILISTLDPTASADHNAAYAAGNITSFSMEFMPRITRAQSMDVLSSQSNLAGYKAVIDAAAEYNRAFPMMMTAAGTVAPAKVMVMGAGVAGLQAIATAKRLGAVVSATDVRAAAKEQVESLGGKFVMVESDETGETEGGYAKEMSDDYKRAQAALIAETLKKQDIAITTALIPGRPAPVLIDDDMVASMKPGSIIVDLAAPAGGNCTQTRPGETYTTENGVTIIAHLNMASRLAADASALYAKNLLNFITPLVNEEQNGLSIDWDDEIIQGTLITKDGNIVHERLTGEN